MSTEMALAGACGVYCGACPSYRRTGSCKGCQSEEKQKRGSKWRCEIRRCCQVDRGLSFCYECGDFPCKVLIKLSESHPGDERYGYRREIIANLLRMKEVGVKLWLKEQEAKWRCHNCGGHVCFYEYKCCDCGTRV